METSAEATGPVPSVMGLNQVVEGETELAIRAEEEHEDDGGVVEDKTEPAKTAEEQQENGFASTSAVPAASILIDKEKTKNGDDAAEDAPDEDVESRVDHLKSKEIDEQVKIAEKASKIDDDHTEEYSANPVSRMYFSFATKLFYDNYRKLRKNKKHSLQVDDFWHISRADHADEVTKRFDVQYSEASSGLRWALAKLVMREMLIAGSLRLVVSGSMVANPLLLEQLLIQLQSPHPNYSAAYGWAAGMGGAMFLKTTFENMSLWLTSRAGWRIRAAVNSAVYRKSLRLSNASRQSKTLGEIVNYMQLDAYKIALCTDQIHALWDAPVQVMAFTVVLYFILGWSTFVGLTVTLLSIPLMGFAVLTLGKLDRRTMLASDERVKSTNEAIQSMLGVKVSVWEEALLAVVEKVRAKEVGFLYSSVYMRAIMACLMTSAPAFASACALTTFALVAHGAITPATLFSAVQAFSFLRAPLMLLPLATAQTVQANVSARRVQAFLNLDEIEQLQKGFVEEEGYAVVIKDATFSWSRKNSAQPAPAANPGAAESKDKLTDPKAVVQPGGSSVTMIEPGNHNNNRPGSTATSTATMDAAAVTRPVLRNINLKVKQGELIAVVGRVGSGKSALLNAILGEIHLLEGSISVASPICAYAAQSPWILNATVRDNILFGAPFEKERYERVIETCQLPKDLELFPDGDRTEIGERGVSLSGGQRQRIATARATYWAKFANDFVILDDILSALDPEVGARLFEECICGFLQGTTRIIVTNQLENIDKFDRVVVIENNTVSDVGTFDELVAKQNTFGRLLIRYGGSSSSNLMKDKVNGQGSSAKGLGAKKKFDSLAGPGSSTALMQVEEREQGAVKASVYHTYILAGGGYGWAAVVLLCFLFMQGSFFINTLWVTWWTNDAIMQYPDSFKTLNFYLIGYFLTAVVMLIGAFSRTFATYWFGIHATTFLQRSAFVAVLHGKMSFFETTPTGRILQRFSRDIRDLDVDLPENLQMFLMTLFFVLWSIGTVCVVTPIFIAFVVPFLLVMYFFLVIYRPVMRDAKRLGSIALSPVYAQFSETLGGLSSIRAFGAVDRFVNKESRLIDQATRLTMYAQKLCERWIGLRVEIFGAAVVLVACCLAVQSASSNGMSPGTAGLSIIYATVVSNMATMLVRSFAVVEASMNSVERVSYFRDNVPQEKWRDEDYKDDSEFIKEPAQSWPEGRIRVENLCLRYRETTPLVLRNVNFDIAPKEKIGIVGRSGSGKSSLFVAILRIVEPVSGSTVLFDDVNVAHIRLDMLRSHVGVAPQFPVLFSGTVRYNVDPFGQYDDAAIWAALEGVGLKESIESLDNKVAESGENFSQGERQLLSLSRLLLRRPRIVLLDEATASLDTEGDERVQHSIRDTFKDSTMLVIAHRLRTIIMSDRILVLAPGGTVAEFDRPDMLLSNPDSQLSLAVAEMGEKQAQLLREASSNLKRML